MSKPKPTVDISGKQVAQVFLNDTFLGEGDFMQDDGSYRQFKLVIEKATMEDLQLPGRSERVVKVVLAFKGAKKRLVVNKTNGAAIKSHYGKQIKDWLGKAVEVYYDPSIKFGRDVVGGVRIKPRG